ncbi:MAG: hypothetical protein MZV64_48510, partial [Ignavibacteriales bacterium]|nr:hypothetical protein [Ignavibacteriales bacterium]
MHSNEETAVDPVRWPLCRCQHRRHRPGQEGRAEGRGQAGRRCPGEEGRSQAGRQGRREEGRAQRRRKGTVDSVCSRLFNLSIRN